MNKILCDLYGKPGENIEKNFIAVCIMTLLHYGVCVLRFKECGLFMIILFIIACVTPIILGSIISMIFLQKTYLVIISQLLFIAIIYIFRVYMHRNNIEFLAVVMLWWFLIINILSAIIAMCIGLVYALILKVHNKSKLEV